MTSDIWLNTGATLSKKDILAVDGRLASLLPYQKNKIFNNNARLSVSGGNDYWESGTLQPQIILKDLIAILHPELLPIYKLYYYQQIQ